MKRLTPPHIVVLSFASVILVGLLLLYLPFFSVQQGSMDYVDALFTSASATCVTG